MMTPAARYAPAAASPAARTTIRIAALSDLRAAQQAARDICRRLPVDGPGVLDAVIAVTELANHHFIGPQRSGRMGLSVVRSRYGIGLEISAEDDAPTRCDGRPARARSRVTFPRARSAR